MRVQVNTRGYGGGKVHKQIVVITNDPNTPKLRLGISGMVEKFASVQPRYLRLFGTAGETIKATVTVKPEKKYPFKVVAARARTGKFIHVRLMDHPEADSPYKIEVENVRRDAGRYVDTVILKTDSTIRPELTINVFGMIRPPESAAGKKGSAAGGKAGEGHDKN